MLRKSSGYEFIRVLIRWVHRLYYREIVVDGLDNIPKGEAIMIAPNHQNAMMDPLAVVCLTDLQPVFLTRADLFTSDLRERALRYFKMLPIYRQRDGGNVLERNQKIFEEVVKILSHKQSVAVFPEATHWGRRSLKPIKKGTARLAIMAEEANEWKLGLKIVPTSIYFSDYAKGKSKLYVRFGKPMEVADYKACCVNNREQAIRALNEDLAKRMKDLMLHIPNIRVHDPILTLCDWYNAEVRKQLGLGDALQDWFSASQHIATVLGTLPEEKEQELSSLGDVLKQYERELKSLGISNYYGFSAEATKTKKWELMKMLGLLPIFLLGYSINYLPLKIPVWYVNYAIKDVLFRSSFKIVLSLLVFPLFYALLGMIAYQLLGSFLYVCFFLGFGAFSANFAVEYSLRTKELLEQIRIRRLEETEGFSDIVARRANIIAQVDSLMKFDKPVQ